MIKPMMRTLTRVLPEQSAASLLLRIASRPTPLPLKPRDEAALARASTFRWGRDDANLAWVWGNGPTVLLLHGWGGRAAQMAPIAEHLADAGFRAIAPDLGGHGESPGRRLGFDRLAKDIATLYNCIDQPIHTMIGHSAGGLAMMRARQMGQISATRYVCINAPRAPYPPIRMIRKRLGPPESVLAQLQTRFARQLGHPMEMLSDGALFQADGGELLLVYDEADDHVHHEDAERIAACWPGAQVLKTTDLGHHRPLWTPDVINAIGEFIQTRPAATH